MGRHGDTGLAGLPVPPPVDLHALPSTGPREVHLESCRISDLSSVASAGGLRFLNASDCGKIESLRPLCGLDDLEILWVYGTTKVLDDDLTPIAALPRLRELRLMSRKTYRPSVEDVQALIARRAGE
jgi:hypothetical protein